LREVARREGRTVRRTYEVNPGEVWEEDEFWIDLSWAIDPDGTRGIRKHFESRGLPPQLGTVPVVSEPATSDEQRGQSLGANDRAGDSPQPVTVDEYYAHIFDRVPGLKEEAAKQGLSPLDYMRKVGAFRVHERVYNEHLKPCPKGPGGSDVIPDEQISVDEFGTIRDNGKSVGVEINGERFTGFPTPSRKLEIWSRSMKEHGWPEHTLPAWIKSHVHPDGVYSRQNGMVLVPTFRLPTLIHTRTGAAKWLNEISNANPLWMHPSDMKARGLANGSLARVTTDIGYFVDRVWATEAIKPGVCACSHHLGRWRRPVDPACNRYSTNLVSLEETGPGKWRMTRTQGVQPFASDDPDSSRIFWEDGGVHQNAAAPVHPDPISGAHCWLQAVTVEKAHDGDQYGTVFADTEKAHQVYKEWKAMTRNQPGPNGERRIPWLNRPLYPAPEAWRR
jgi:hypothetical protein